MKERKTPVEIDKESFKKIGHKLVDTIADFLEEIQHKPVTSAESPKTLQQLIGDRSLPDNGADADGLLSMASKLLIDHSLFNGHPKFFGYITSSAAPIGALADLLAASINPNVGAQILSPVATEIEKQTVRWLAEFIGVSPNCGGLLVSGGNMANFTGFLAGRTAMAPKNIKEEGLTDLHTKLTVYCPKTTHTWIEKAVVLFGLGTNCLRWIETDKHNKMNIGLLQTAIKNDVEAGCKPMMVIGTAGDVSTGAVDDLGAIAAICKQHGIWFHIDGAYGMPAAAIPSLKHLFAGIESADSIALDPHKWLYSPLEAGCTLVKNPNYLIETFSSHPVYYNFDNAGEGKPQNFYEYGLQNSRGFRALKVWLQLQQCGRNGYVEMISEDIRLSQLMFRLADEHNELEAITQSLSITTLRYTPIDKTTDTAYLNELNEKLLNVLQQGGEVFLSNALVNDKYCLRACIVNFRTTEKDIYEVIEIIVAAGRKLHAAM